MTDPAPIFGAVPPPPSEDLTGSEAAGFVAGVALRWTLAGTVVYMLFFRDKKK